MDKSHLKISKFLSLVLRHKPEVIGLKLDGQGWASIQEIIDKADLQLDAGLIGDVVLSNDKQRFIISDDGTFIRANQGHSIKVDLGLTPITPPETLYHGTATRFLDAIMAEGLLPQDRHHVHLSGDMETAVKVGGRHGKPHVLIIDAGRMADDGIKFYRSENGVWLTDKVDVTFIKLEE